MKVVAVIPLKDKSDRVENKNFRHFVEGISLAELKIQHLINSGVFDRIYVSSDSITAKNLTKKYNLTYIKRDKYYCNNTVSWSDVIFEVVNSLPEPENTSIAWCHVTSPLFDRYNECIQQYKKLDKSKYNGLVVVAPLSDFIISERAKPINYHWGVWHEYSQDLDKLYTITGALFVSSKKEMLKNRYVIATKPYLFEVSSLESIDIDTELQFRLAQLIYKNEAWFDNA